MATLKLTNGSASGVITGDMAAFVKDLLDRTQNAAVKTLREAGESVASNAHADWYNQVQKDTGKSGDIIAVTSVNPGTGDVKMSVGSTDKRTSDGRPVPVYIHAPFPGALVRTEVSLKEYNEAPRSEKAWKDKVTGKTYVWRAPKQKQTGDYLLETLVKAPMRKSVKGVAKNMAREAIKGRKKVSKG